MLDGLDKVRVLIGARVARGAPNFKQGRLEMRIDSERYEGATEERDGFDESPGAIYSFTESDRTFRFQIEDSMPQYAVSRGATIEGAKVEVFRYEPYSDNPSVIGIPSKCPIFISVMKELRSRGVRQVRFYDRVTGGFASIPVDELIPQ